jgi:flagellar motor protein MotB
MRASVLGVLVSLVAIGCQNKLHDENRALWEQNRELQARLASSSNEPKADPAQVSQLQAQIAERDAKLAELQTQLRQPTAGAAAPGIEGIEATYDDASGKMTVALPGDVLFNSGDATVRDSARSTLDKVASSLKKDYANKKVRIEGHTDADPIKYSKWKSNQELSEARAAAVKSYLVKKGVDTSLVTVAGFGADKPKSKSKEANRRVDIVVATR